MLTNEQIEQRLNYITGSDAPIILGLSKYCTPYQLWLYKTRREVAPNISDNPSVKAGNMLEEAVIRWLGHEINKCIFGFDPMIVHNQHKWMGANVDGIIAENKDDIKTTALFPLERPPTSSLSGIKEIVEIKTAQHDSGWGDSGTSIIPPAYRAQCAHYMAVTNAERCYVGVLIRGIDFRWFLLDRCLDFETFLIAREKEFWDCVQADIPPEPSNTQDVVRMFEGKCTDKQKVADISLEAHVLHYKELREQIKHLEEAEERIKLEICKEMGEYSTLVDRGGRVIATWNKPKETTRFDAKKFSLEYPDIYKKYMYNTETSRRFLVK